MEGTDRHDKLSTVEGLVLVANGGIEIAGQKWSLLLLVVFVGLQALFANGAWRYGRAVSSKAERL